MLRFLPYLHLLVLAACAAPSVAVMGGHSRSVEVGQYQFSVNFKGSQAEAYRSNIMWAPKEHQVFSAATTAIEQATGCRVVQSTLRGDVALVQADMLC